MEINPPSYYHKIAKEYIIKQAKYLEENEPKYYLDKDLAFNYVKFASLLKHTAGEYGGINFQFQEWQLYAIIDIFGTKHKEGEYKDLRRYQRVLFFVSKKNGKTEYTALLHILYFFLDKEKAKTQYTIGKSLNQAITLRDAVVTMIMQNEDLKEMVHSTKQPPRITKNNGAFVDIFEALASDSDNHEGKNVSFFTVDEGHTHPNKDLYQIISNGTVGRNEPLEIHLSTAGYNQNGYFYRDIYLYAKKIKQGIIKDETFYQIMFELDDEDLKDPDFWKNKELWKKANPNLGKSPTWSGMEKEYRSALESEQSLVAFKTKNLNVWCDKITTWINSSTWSKNQSKIGFTKLKELKNRKCYAGLDLSTNIDLTAFVLLFDDEKGNYDVIPYFWIPKDNMLERVKKDKVPYLDWVKKGLIRTTEGNVVDYDFIQADIIRLCNFFNIKMIAYDRWNSSDLIRRLTEAEVTDLIQFGQGYSSMSAPTKQIEVLALQGRLNHGNNEVLAWNISNVAIKRDPADNIKIDKNISSERVDGAVALAMALGICLKDTEEDEKVNVYEKRGMRIL